MLTPCASSFVASPVTLPAVSGRAWQTRCIPTARLSRRACTRLLALSVLPALSARTNQWSAFSFTSSAMAEEASDSMSVTPINKDNEVSSFTQLACPVTNADCRPIEIRDFRVGSGETAILGSTLTLKWTGRLADRYGWPFQRETDEPVVIVLGKDRLIEGFEKGIEGMRAGGKRRIVIPGEFGYRSQEDGPLPSDFGDRRRLWATVLNPRRFKRAGDLVIDVQLKKVRLSGTAK